MFIDLIKIIEIAIPIVPVIIFIWLIRKFKKTHKKRISGKRGGLLFLRISEGFSAAALFFATAINPDWIRQVAELRVAITVAAPVWVWEMYVMVDRIMLDLTDLNTTKE